jgi:hypothetical protein
VWWGGVSGLVSLIRGYKAIDRDAAPFYYGRRTLTDAAFSALLIGPKNLSARHAIHESGEAPAP